MSRGSSYVEDVKAYLEEKGMDFDLLQHPLSYTAQETAGAQHVSGRRMAKSVIVKAGDEYIMCVLPAIHLIDFTQLKALLGHDDVRLATEEEIAGLFPDCDVGAEPPFGEWYRLRVYQDSKLSENETIVFNAGTHTDTIEMRYEDWRRLNNPTEAAFGAHI